MSVKKYYRDVITLNEARCLKCGDVIRSTYTHDFVTCTCGNLSVDGGLSYIRRCFGDAKKYEELSKSYQEEREPYDYELARERKDEEDGRMD